MVKVIKPTIGKRETENKPIETVNKEEFKSINIMGNIDKVMKAWDQYSNITHRTRNAVPYVKSQIPDKTWTPGYIRSLRSYGTRLKDAGVYDNAMKEDWDFVKISDFFRKNKNKQEQQTPVEEPKPMIKSKPGEETAEEYIKRTRPGIG